MARRVIHARLKAVRRGAYTMYVFEDLESENYIMCTKLPNWESPEMFVGDVGFLRIDEVKAGETYINPNTAESSQYRYTNVYFDNFVKESDMIKNSEIIL